MLLYEAMMKRTGAAILPFEDRDEVPFEDFIRDFRWGGVPTSAGQIEVCVDQGAPLRVNTFTNEFWTAK